MNLDNDEEKRHERSVSVLAGALQAVIWSIPFILLLFGSFDALAGAQYHGLAIGLMFVYFVLVLISVFGIVGGLLFLGVSPVSLAQRTARRSRKGAVAALDWRSRAYTWMTAILQGVIGNFVYFLCGIAAAWLFGWLR